MASLSAAKPLRLLGLIFAGVDRVKPLEEKLSTGYKTKSLYRS